MKRFFLISITVLIAALLMVSCNMDSKLDDGLAILSFQASDDELTSKNLTRTNPVLNPEDLWWSYTANKAEDDKTNLTTGSTGETKTTIGTQTQGLKTSVGPFSYGKWVFTLYGYTDSNRTQLAYQGTSTVTISSTKTTISVTVKSLGSGNGTLQIPAKGAIKLKLNNDSDITDYSAFVEKVAIVALDAGSTYKQETPAYIESTSDVTNISLPSGSYSVTVSYQSKKDPTAADSDQTAPIIYAQDTIYVTIADYLTTKIGGDIKENNSQVEFFADGEIIKAKTSETLKSNEATVLTVNAAPVSATSETVAETTVSIPEGAITTTEDSTVALEVISYSPTAVSTENDETESGFTITSTTETNPVLGVLDIKLYVGNSDTPTTVFNDSKVLTVTTKVAKGLNGGKDYKTGDSENCSIHVQYNGEGAAGAVTSYNVTTGELVFTVSHLSTYYVVDTNAVVYNSTEDKAYTGLADAVADATAGDTLMLMKDTQIDVELDINTSMTIDFNQKTLSFNKPLKDDTPESKQNNSYGNGISIGQNGNDKTDPTVVFKNGKISGEVYSHNGINAYSGNLKIESMNIELSNSGKEGLWGIYITGLQETTDTPICFEMKNSKLDFTSDYANPDTDPMAAIYICEFSDTWYLGSITIDNCEITAKSTATNKKVIGISINNAAEDSKYVKDITISNSTITSDYIGMKSCPASTNYTINLLNSTFISDDDAAIFFGGKYKIENSTFNSSVSKSLTFLTYGDNSSYYDTEAELKNVKLVNKGLMLVDITSGQKKITLSGTLTADSIQTLENQKYDKYEITIVNNIPTIQAKTTDANTDGNT